MLKHGPKSHETKHEDYHRMSIRMKQYGLSAFPNSIASTLFGGGVGGSLGRSVTGLRFGLAAQPLDESSASSRAGARESD